MGSDPGQYFMKSILRFQASLRVFFTWNMKKSNWEGYNKEVKKILQEKLVPNDIENRQSPSGYNRRSCPYAYRWNENSIETRFQGCHMMRSRMTGVYFLEFQRRFRNENKKKKWEEYTNGLMGNMNGKSSWRVIKRFADKNNTANSKEIWGKTTSERNTRRIMYRGGWIFIVKSIV